MNGWKYEDAVKSKIAQQVNRVQSWLIKLTARGLWSKIEFFFKIFFKFLKILQYKNDFIPFLKGQEESPGQGGSNGTLTFCFHEVSRGQVIKSMKNTPKKIY